MNYVSLAVAVALTTFAQISFSSTAPKIPAASACGLFMKSVASGTAPQKLQRFLDAQWKYLMLEFPESATYVGYPGQDHRWTDRSLSAFSRRKIETHCQLQELQKISRNRLKKEDQLTLDLAVRDLKLSIENDAFDGNYLVLDHMNGLQLDLPDLISSMPKANVKNIENMIARLETLPVLEEQLEVLLREGLKRKVTPVRSFLQKVPGQFDAVLTSKIQDSPIYKAFEDLSALLPEDQTRLRMRALEVIEARAYPALKKLRAFLTTEYIPNARESISWSEMPNGPKWYAYLVKSHTTVNLSPEELHQLGLSEVARLTQQMNKVLQSVHFKGDLKAFNQYLLKDSRFYFKDPADLLMAYRDIAKRIDPELTKLFKRLPRLPYGVREMASYKAAAAPTAYYQPGSLNAGRAGYFEANTYDLKARPTWAMEALTLHEAVPGHHLQISLAQEIEGLPEFRKNGGTTAFIEGWALYAESLGERMGFYQDPYSKYGQLSYELWRAVRLVVDTGMHAKGWSRAQALQYFMDLMPKSALESEVEIDRYITWPGQALAYKVGQLKFLELRQKAQAALGDAFDIRLFHDEVLCHGALPMETLESLFNEWLAAQKKESSKTQNKKTGV